ncbi:MAG TPA: PEFG-CTERM sorting domain-containing protein [Nitrosopumilaceae archaeon]|nr:PEFG-CTERM sorting domain-containing protein [Nitrosopumilaceae archaeon]
MNKNILAAVAIFSVFSIVPQTVFGQIAFTEQSCITCDEIPDQQAFDNNIKLAQVVIWTDYPIYDRDSTIHVFGHTNVPSDIPVTLRVINPLGAIASIEQIMPDENGDFTADFKPGGNLWKKEGSYIISAYAGIGADKIYRVQVKVLDYAGSDMLARYEIEGGSVTGIQADSTINTLTITLANTETGGAIKLYLPRDIIDAKEHTKQFSGLAGAGIPQQYTTNSDRDFMILVDGISFSKVDANFAEKEFKNILPAGMYAEKTTFSTRIITIPFSEGTEKIEIIGTFVVPEFGSYAAIILAVAIMSIVLLVKGPKLRLLEFAR